MHTCRISETQPTRKKKRILTALNQYPIEQYLTMGHHRNFVTVCKKDFFKKWNTSWPVVFGKLNMNATLQKLQYVLGVGNRIVVWTSEGRITKYQNVPIPTNTFGQTSYLRNTLLKAKRSCAYSVKEIHVHQSIAVGKSPLWMGTRSYETKSGNPSPWYNTAQWSVVMIFSFLGWLQISGQRFKF